MQPEGHEGFKAATTKDGLVEAVCDCGNKFYVGLSGNPEELQLEHSFHLKDVKQWTESRSIGYEH